MHPHHHNLALRFCTAAMLLLLLMTPAQAEDHLVKHSTVPIHLRGISADMTSSVDDVIIQQIDLAGDTEASAALADDLSFFVRRHYLAQGFLKAGVEWKLEGKDILLIVAEGERQRVGKITFEGNPGLSVSELQRYLLRPTRERVGRFAASTPYVEKEVNEGLSLVLRYVLSQGYADAAVDTPIATNRDDGTTDISVTIVPGAQWHVGEVQVSGAPPVLEELTRFEARALRGQPVNDARIENTRRQLEGEIQSRGYFAGKCTSTTTRASGQLMDVQFTLVPGSLHQISELQIDPAFSRGATRLVRSAFRPAVGQVYDSQRMELAYSHIIDTGIFEHLDMEPKAAGDGQLALAFSGQEAKRSSVGLSGGYDTFLGAILGIEYKNVNWWDNGSTLSAKIVGTQLGLLAGVQWKNPAVFDSRYGFAIGIKPETFTFDGYTRHTLALRAAISRDFSKHLSMEFYADSSVNTVTSSTLTAAEVGPTSYNMGTVGLSLLYEDRDNPVAPTRGWFASATVEGGKVSGGTVDVNYTHTDFALSFYQPISTKWRAALGAHFASIISSQNVEFIPIELREYNGGAKGVRSFAERGLGPKASDGTPLGGTQTETVSGEVSYEIVKNLEVAGFVDAGELDTGKANVLPKFDDLRYAAGIGIRYRLPFGPLRVDYGVNLDKRTGEPGGALHIGFGFAF